MRASPSAEDIRVAVAAALQEDAPRGDITAEACIGEDAVVDADLVAKAVGVIAGCAYAVETFRQCGVECRVVSEDGSTVKPRSHVLEIRGGNARGVLRAERTALNFLGHLSGVATAAAEFVRRVEDTEAVILDTRKTTPGLRLAEKAAVRAGGAQNHRIGLSDGILIKENHIRSAGDVHEAVRRALQAAPVGVEAEVEVTTVQELRDAIDAGARRVLLDNMDLFLMRHAAAVARAAGVKTEASGGVTLKNVRQIAETGVDFISIGWITHSAPCLDLSLLVGF